MQLRYLAVSICSVIFTEKVLEENFQIYVLTFKAAQLLKEAVAWNAKEKRDKSDMKVVWRKTAEFHLKGIMNILRLKVEFLQLDFQTGI